VEKWEENVLDVQAFMLENVGRRMYAKRLSRQDVAASSGIRMRRLLQILDGSDLTMREMADVGYAVGIRWNIKLVNKQ